MIFGERIAEELPNDSFSESREQRSCSPVSGRSAIEE
jgi:hypothetical protein